MEKITIVRFIIPVVFISTVFLGPIFNFFLFLYRKILNSYWSFFITNIQFADLMAVTFILFTTFFLLTYHYSEKFATKPVIFLGTVTIGYSCIYSAFVWNWVTFALLFLITGIAMGFIIPKIIEILYDISNKEDKQRFELYVIPLFAIIWVLIQGIVFEMIGMQSWRILYLIIGIINITSAPWILVYKES
jgi:MFS family permease